MGTSQHPRHSSRSPPSDQHHHRRDPPTSTQAALPPPSASQIEFSSALLLGVDPSPDVHAATAGPGPGPGPGSGTGVGSWVLGRSASEQGQHQGDDQYHAYQQHQQQHHYHLHHHHRQHGGFQAPAHVHSPFPSPADVHSSFLWPPSHPLSSSSFVSHQVLRPTVYSHQSHAPIVQAALPIPQSTGAGGIQQQPYGMMHVPAMSSSSPSSSSSSSHPLGVGTHDVATLSGVVAPETHPSSSSARSAGSFDAVSPFDVLGKKHRLGRRPSPGSTSMPSSSSSSLFAISGGASMSAPATAASPFTTSSAGWAYPSPAQHAEAEAESSRARSRTFRYANPWAPWAAVPAPGPSPGPAPPPEEQFFKTRPERRAKNMVAQREYRKRKSAHLAALEEENAKLKKRIEELEAEVAEREGEGERDEWEAQAQERGGGGSGGSGDVDVGERKLSQRQQEPSALDEFFHPIDLHPSSASSGHLAGSSGGGGDGSGGGGRRGADHQEDGPGAFPPGFEGESGPMGRPCAWSTTSRESPSSTHLFPIALSQQCGGFQSDATSGESSQSVSPSSSFPSVVLSLPDVDRRHPPSLHADDDNAHGWGLSGPSALLAQGWNGHGRHATFPLTLPPSWLNDASGPSEALVVETTAGRHPEQQRRPSPPCSGGGGGGLLLVPHGHPTLFEGDGGDMDVDPPAHRGSDKPRDGSAGLWSGAGEQDTSGLGLSASGTAHGRTLDDDSYAWALAPADEDEDEEWRATPPPPKMSVTRGGRRLSWLGGRVRLRDGDGEDVVADDDADVVAFCGVRRWSTKAASLAATVSHEAGGRGGPLLSSAAMAFSGRLDGVECAMARLERIERAGAEAEVEVDFVAASRRSSGSSASM